MKCKILFVALSLLFLIAISSTVFAAPEKPVADFYSPRVLDQQNGNEIGPSEEISFIDTSKGLPTSWIWDFGDGNTSTEQNPTHVYGAIGGYTVTLTVENAAGNNTTSKYGYVLVDEASGTYLERADSAHFSSNTTSGNAPFKVTFHDERSTYTFLECWSRDNIP
jgi:PKD repeat protein